MGNFPDRLRQVLRRLGRAPLFTSLTLITLAVGIGATTLIFSVVDGVLLKPLPYAKPQQLIGVWFSSRLINLQDLNMAPFLYFIMREQSKTLEDIGLYQGDSISVTGKGAPTRVGGLDVTEGVLPILGVKPSLGRPFTQQDDTAGSPETVMLSYAYWQKNFGGARSVIGQSITVNGEPREIIGVLPRGFHFLNLDDAALILPMQLDRSKTKLGNFSYEGLARLKPGVTMEQASTDLQRLIPIATRSFPPPEGYSEKLFEQADLRMNLHSLKQDVVGDVGNVLWVLMGSIGLVLLIACANVANLLLVRVEGRRQELAIISALGAGWTRIAGDLLFESVTLTLIGSALGLGLAFGGLKVLMAMAPDLPRIRESWNQFARAAIRAGNGDIDGCADRTGSGFQVCWRATEQRIARGREGTEPEPGAAPCAEYAGGGTSGAGPSAADLFRADDPDVSSPGTGECRFYGGEFAADLLHFCA